MSRLQFAIEQITFARAYTVRLLENVKEEDWFRMPPGGVTHVGWQVGHLAMAQYLRGMELRRGRRPEDEGLIPEAFRQRFRRLSVPDADPASYPPAGEIRAVFDRVHRRLLEELPGFPEADLDSRPLREHSL